MKKRTRFIFDSNDFVSVKCDESCILSKEHSLAASVDGQLVANAQNCHAGEFGNGRGKLIPKTEVRKSIVWLQVIW